MSYTWQYLILGFFIHGDYIIKFLLATKEAVYGTVPCLLNRKMWWDILAS